MKEKLQKRSYWLTPGQAQYITKVARKKDIKESHLMREVIQTIIDEKKSPEKKK